MTLDEAVASLLALRERLPADPDADQARAVLDELAKARSDRRREELVRTAVALLLDIGVVRGDVPIAVQFGPHETLARDVEWAGDIGAEEPAAVEPDTAPSSRGRRVGTPRSAPGQRAKPPGRPAMIERVPHIDVDAAQPIPVGTRMKVSVYLNRKRQRRGEHGDTLQLPALDELRLGVTLTTSTHFTIRGDDHDEIVVRAAERASSTASFEVECVAGGEGRPGVAATFTYAWRPAGSVWRELEVRGSAPARPKRRPAAAVTVDPDARPHDLVVTISPSPDADEQHFDVKVSSRHLDDYAHGVVVPWKLPQRTKEYVDGFMEAFTTSDPGGRKAALVGAGLDLFDATPAAFREAFWQLVEAGKLETIYVVTSEPYIPWELMVPSDDANGRPARQPLGVEFSVGRWVHPQLVSSLQLVPLVDSYVIAPSYRGEKKLDFAVDEAKLVLETFAGMQITPAFIKTIDDTLAVRGATLLHLICHGLDASAGQVLDLDPDERLREVQLRGLAGVARAVREHGPLVFINACQVGRVAPALAGTGGFAARFTLLGARCVIAPIWSVKDSVAGKVARMFYERLKAEPTAPFATIIRDIRKLAYEGSDPEDSYAAYCFYGDPLAARERA